MSLSRFQFRDCPEGVHFATASDRYAGWLGQIYSPEKNYQLSKTRKTIKAQQ